MTIKKMAEIRSVLIEITRIISKMIDKDKGYRISKNFKVCKEGFQVTICEYTSYDAPDTIIVNIPFWFYDMYKDGKRRMFNWINTKYYDVEFFDNRKTLYVCDVCETPTRITNEDKHSREWRCECCGEKIED